VIAAFFAGKKPERAPQSAASCFAQSGFQEVGEVW
jgi:hypothetical protein